MFELSSLSNYFNDLFSSNGCDANSILNNISLKITSDHNNNLIAPFQADEIKAAIFSMHPDKSPGPERFNPCFYQKHWDVVGSKVTTSCLRWLNSGFLPDGIHDTNLVLIQKKLNPKVVSDLRPIALYNVIYKIISKTIAFLKDSKTIANRLKTVLQLIISPT
ncbi:hypothetical protein M5689_006348 [Euphorbia peplus]|nr:hypothetical protein M5689_006348 [Euphorbia peplus]